MERIRWSIYGFARAVNYQFWRPARTFSSLDHRPELEFAAAVRVFARVFGLVLAVSGAAAAQDGSAVFQANCATCHAAAAQQARSPSIDTLRRQTPEAILNALLNGKMRIQAVALSDAQRRAVAEFLGGRAL
jgi:mono/diheme cytochrome c family protein